MIEKIKTWLASGSKDEDRFKNLHYLAIPAFLIILAIAGAFTVHSIDQHINNAEAVDVELTSEQLNDYEEQIVDFISYENFDSMILGDTYKKKDKTYVHVFDGYTDNIFVFKDDILYQYGTTVSGDFINVKE